MKKAVGYVWLNLGKNNNLKAMVDEVRTELEGYCKKEKLKLTHFYTDINAVGVITERKEMRDLLDRMHQEDLVLVVSSLEHFGRRFHDVLSIVIELDRLSREFVSVKEGLDTRTEEGKKFIRGLLSIPQMISSVRPGKKSSGRKPKRAREVLYNGGACPYGYKVDVKTNEYTVIGEEASVVQRIFSERISGRSLRQIANSLIQDGIATKRGGRWQANTIKTILENIFYIGVYQYNDTLYWNDHEAVVSRRTFLEVNPDSILPIAMASE